MAGPNEKSYLATLRDFAMQPVQLIKSLMPTAVDLAQKNLDFARQPLELLPAARPAGKAVIDQSQGDSAFDLKSIEAKAAAAIASGKLRPAEQADTGPTGHADVSNNAPNEPGRGRATSANVR